MIGFLPLVLVALLGSDPQAESLFTAMTEKVRSAKTLQIVCRGSFKTTGFEADLKATLLLKEGNRMRLELDSSGTRDGKPHSYSLKMISDGTTIRMSERKGSWSEFKTTPHWNEQVATNICRGGFPSGLELARFREEGQTEAAAMTFRPMAPPADFVLWPGERLQGHEVRPIEFKARSDSEFTRETASILWLDASSGLPAKRMMIVRSDRTLTVSEGYDKFAVNEPLEDSLFSAPKEQ